MNSLRILFRSLVYFRRTHIPAAICCAICCAAITGALITGDSVRETLRRFSAERLGRTEYALDAGSRFFSRKLADGIRGQISGDAEAVLRIQGLVSTQGGTRRSNSTRIVGVDSDFGRLWNGPDSFPKLRPGAANVNTRLAQQLGIQVGDEILVQTAAFSEISGEIPFAGMKQDTASLRLSVQAILPPSAFGRFSLAINQVPPLTVFVQQRELAELIDKKEKANLILAAPVAGTALEKKELNRALSESWSLSDTSLEVRELEKTGEIELFSRSLFLPDMVSSAAENAGTDPRKIFSYFANAAQTDNAVSHYFFVSTALPDQQLGNREIIINNWLARDLDAQVGDSIELTYFKITDGRKLVEEKTGFTVREIVPVGRQGMDPSMAPEIPGLTDVPDCDEWDPSLPVDLKKVTDRDEEYWDKYRAAPRALVSLETARELWSSRYGSLTAVRYPAALNSVEAVRQKLTRELGPQSFGLFFQDVRRQGTAAADQSVDFGMLFLGLSFFIVIAALLLTGLLFLFSVEMRSKQTGTLLALGFTPSRIQRIYTAEGLCVACVGSIIGAVSGIFYTRLVLYGLESVWKGAVNSSGVSLYVHTATLGIGTISTVAAAGVVLWSVARKQGCRSVSRLHRSAGTGNSRRTRSGWISPAAAVGVVLIFLFSDISGGKGAAAQFFAAGFLMLVFTLSLFSFLLHLFSARPGALPKTLSLAMQNMVRKKSRSLVTCAVIASGVFLTIAVGLNRHDPAADSSDNKSGTGGFEFYGETSIPFVPDLNNPDIKGNPVKELLSLNPDFLLFRIQGRDDASCLNLNRVSAPRLLGIDKQRLAERNAFRFVKTAESIYKGDGSPWNLLNQDLGEDTIAGIGDMSMIQWGMGKSLGDEVAYTDHTGHRFNVRLVGGLANSVFQGSILISEQNFRERFPGAAGYQGMLVDTAPKTAEQVSERLSFLMADYGLRLESAEERLRMFYRIESTYLSIFLTLGAIGLVLGTAGLGMVVLRNISERRQELALLRAVGFSRKTLMVMLLAEHTVLLAAGLVCGTVSALVAVLPALMERSSGVGFTALAVMLAAILLNGLVWTFLATRSALRGNLLSALRRE